MATAEPVASSNNNNKEKQRHVQQPKKPELSEPPAAELLGYALIVATSLLYFGYNFYLSYGANPVKSLPYRKLRLGWLRKYKDAPQDSMYELLCQKWLFLTVTSCGFLAVSRLTLRFASDSFHHLSCALYTICLSQFILGWRPVAYLLTLHALTAVAGRISLACVWALLLCAMTAQNHSSVNLFGPLTDQQVSVLFPMIGYYYCRLLSMGHSISQGGNANALIGLHYVFYLPYYYVGPILTFDNFCSQIGIESRRMNAARLTRLIFTCLRLLLWLLVFEAVAHYLPVVAFFSSVVSYSAYSHLVFAMYTLGQCFMLLYVQMYGWGTAVAELDGIRLPDWPACISRVYTYREMWRVFDRGLFAVMQSHVYIPLGGNRAGWLRQAVATLASFGFVCVYHGDTQGIRLWVLLNAAQVLAEQLAVSAYWRWGHETLSKYLHPGLQSRLVVFVVSWNLLLSCCTIFFFFVEDKAVAIATEVLVKPLLLQRPFYPLLVFACLAYCFTQLGMAYKRREQRMTRQKKSQ